MNFIKHYDELSVITWDSAIKFNSELESAINTYQRRGFCVDVEYSTCISPNSQIIFSAIVLAYKPK